MPPRKDLGSILVDENIVGQKDLERVERERKESGRPLWAALIDAKLTTDNEIFFVMAQRFGTPVLAEEVIAEVRMPAAETLRRALTREQALQGGLLPIELAADSSRVTVVMIDPSDEQTLAALLRRAQIPEGRALLGRKTAIERAIDRCYGQKSAQASTIKSPPLQPILRKDPTASVKLDPELAAEIQKLPEEARAAPPPDERSQPERRPVRPRRATPQGTSPADTEGGEAVRAEERLSRALIQAIEALARELEERVIAAPPGQESRIQPGRAGDMARLARRVARQLGLGRRASEEIGVASLLFAIDSMLRAEEGAAVELVGDLGWPAAGDGGLLAILRSLTAASAGFSRSGGGTPPLGARIVSVVADYLALGVAGSDTDLETVSQLLRASAAGAPVVDALLRVLETEQSSSEGDVTPRTRAATVPMVATSLLKEGPPSTPNQLAAAATPGAVPVGGAAPTPAAGTDSSLQIKITPPEPPQTKLRDQDEKTQRKAVPTGRPRRHTPQE